MEKIGNPDFLFYYDHPAVPTLPPALGSAKLWEIEEDNAYLKYLYPQITKQIMEFVEEECDQLEYDGSIMFDTYPDKIALRRLALKIQEKYKEKYPDTHPSLDMIEVLLFHEIIYRRNRYRNHKRLYL